MKLFTNVRLEKRREQNQELHDLFRENDAIFRDHVSKVEPLPVPKRPGCPETSSAGKPSNGSCGKVTVAKKTNKRTPMHPGS